LALKANINNVAMQMEAYCVSGTQGTSRQTFWQARVIANLSAMFRPTGVVKSYSQQVLQLKASLTALLLEKLSASL
jgi:hypothetical protein